MEPIIYSLLANDLTRLILKELEEKRKVKFKELRLSLIDQTDENTSCEQVQETLDTLKERKFVNVVPSRYRDFDSYYLTAVGLQTIRSFNTVFATSK
jgi:DNA-binding HxlR family transcriptional regulator